MKKSTPEQIAFIEQRLKIAKDHKEWYARFHDEKNKNYIQEEIDLFESVIESLKK